MTTRLSVPLALALLLGVAGAHAQTAPAQAAPAAAPAPLVVYFDTNSASVRTQDEPVLDHASRLYNEGRPIVMVITGATDAVGRPELNLTLSQQRATAVLHALLARGIPAERFQVLAKGETDPAVQTPAGAAEAQNRRVEITWR